MVEEVVSDTNTKKNVHILTLVLRKLQLNLDDDWMGIFYFRQNQTKNAFV